MTGRIKSLSAGHESGFITAESRLSVYFNCSAVLAYDIACLAVGQLVTFDLQDGAWPKAINVCVQRQHYVPPASEKHAESIRLRYMGFEQTGSMRAYRFDRVLPGEETRTFVVTTDLALFRKHHVGIQDGPALCLQALLAELHTAGPLCSRPLRRALSDQDMLAHLASRPAPRAKPRFRGAPRARVASHVV